MEKLVVKESVNNNRGEIETSLSLLSFKKKKVFIIYSPALDLSGYGYTEAEAKDSFKEALSEFFRYTSDKESLVKELKRLGWKITGTLKRPKISSSPDLSDLIQSNDELKKLFSEKQFTKYNQKVRLPEFI